MIARNHASGIVVTSSAASNRVFAGMVTYSCVKTFASFLGEGLHYELKQHNIDVLAWDPLEVGTKMLGKEANGKNVLSTDFAVHEMLKQLGRNARSHGAYKHQFLMMIQGLVLGVMPTSYF